MAKVPINPSGRSRPPWPGWGWASAGVAGIGFVPTSEFTCKIFFFPKKEKKIQTWETYARYDAKKDKWEIADERNPEIFASTFVEDFYVFIRKNDYYFVTESGKLYYAPAPKAGEKSRTMKSLWQGENFPIVAIIEDADNDKVWLFTKARKRFEPDGVFFEMASDPAGKLRSQQTQAGQRGRPRSPASGIPAADSGRQEEGREMTPPLSTIFHVSHKRRALQ